MEREPWSKEARNFIYDMLSNGMAGLSTNKIALVTKLSEEDFRRLQEEGIIESHAGTTLYRFGENFLMRAVAMIMEKFLPGEQDAAEAPKSGRRRGPEYPCLFTLKQALKTMRQRMAEALADTGFENGDYGTDVEISLLRADLCLTDEGLSVSPSFVMFSSGGVHSAFTLKQMKRFTVSLEPTGD